MRVKVEFEGEIRYDIKDYYDVKDKYGSVRHIEKEYCTIIEEPVEFNVGDIVERAGNKAIVYRVDDKTLNVMDLSGRTSGLLYKKDVKLLKKATYKEEE